MWRALVGLTLTLALLAPQGSAGAADSTHSLAVSGVGAGMYPAFSESVHRYAITTTAETAGTVQVVAGSSEPEARIEVNGVPAPGGVRDLVGLQPGDEVAVFVTDSAGTARYSLVYLPAGFPRLERVPGLGEPSPGLVMLTLGKWVSSSPFFEAAVDANGVPAFVQETLQSMDLRRQPNGHYSVARGSGTDAGAEIVELDEQLREVRRHRTVGLTHTDGHDALLLPDGSAYLMAYEPDPDTGLTDAVVQHVSASGELLFEWNSADHGLVAETVLPGSDDYAHINSLDVMDDGDLLLSFRHLSAVLKVARTAHGEHAEGDVVWKLGGRDSDFTFTDQQGMPDGGPCAQHTASELPNGNIVVFDNGAWNLDPLCIDPADPWGAPVARTPTRVTEWALDETTGAATMVRNYQRDGHYAIFAGSAQPLVGGNIVIGWASETKAMVTELDDQDRVIWELKDPAPTGRYFTYRAFKTDVPDRVAPEVTVDLAEGSVLTPGASVTPRVECTDQGGSSLQTCARGSIDTSTPGTRDFVVTATDGAGNTTQVRRTYTVPAAPTPPATTAPAPVAQPRPDALVRLRPSKRFLGNDVYDVRKGQVASRRLLRRHPAVTVVRVQNDGTVPEAFRVRVRKGVVVRGQHSHTARTRTSPVLAPGESWQLRVRLRPRAKVRLEHRLTLRATVRSTTDRSIRDQVWARVRVPLAV